MDQEIRLRLDFETYPPGGDERDIPRIPPRWGILAAFRMVQEWEEEQDNGERIQ